MQRLATPMVGGLASAALLTLVVLPAAYMLIHRVRLRDTLAGPEGNGASDHCADSGGTVSHGPSATPRNA